MRSTMRRQSSTASGSAKAHRLRCANNDMADLEQQLGKRQMREVRLIATDGVFSMDGIIANLPALCELAQRHDAAVLVDDNRCSRGDGPARRRRP